MNTILLALVTINTKEMSCENNRGENDSEDGNSEENADPATEDEKNQMKSDMETNLGKENMWRTGPPTCPPGYVWNGKSRCWKILDGNHRTYEQAVKACNDEESGGSSWPVLKKGSAELFQFREEEDFVMLNYGLVAKGWCEMNQQIELLRLY